MAADDRPSRQVVSDEESSDPRLSRRAFVTTGALAGAAALFGRPAAAQTDVTVAFSDETAAPGEQVSVVLTVAEEDSPDTQISGYELGIGFDENIVSFVDANGIDMDDPVTNERAPGELTISAVNPDGVAVTLTAAELVFDVDGSVDPGSVSVVSILDGELLDRDVEQVSFTGSDGSVTVSDDEGENEDDDEGEDEDDDEDDGEDENDEGEDEDDEGEDENDEGEDEDDDGEDEDDGGEDEDDEGEDEDDEGEDEDDDGEDEDDEGEDEDGDEDDDEGEDEDGDEDDDEGDESGGRDDDNGGEEQNEDGDDDSGDDGFGPGLGAGSALTALGGVGYMLHRRLAGEERNS